MSYPYTQFNFLLEIDGIVSAGFTEVSGINSVTEVIKYRTGDAFYTSKVGGLSTVEDITLKRGYTDNTDLADWRKTVTDGLTARKNGAIILLNEARQPVIRNEFTEAWPCKYEGMTLNATANEIAVETLVLTFETLQTIWVGQ